MRQLATLAHPSLDRVRDLGRSWGKRTVIGTIYEGFCRLHGYDPFGVHRDLRRAQVRALIEEDIMPPIIKAFVH